jgi:16S rRNA (guanine527-N7)-methyltransferase
MTPAEFAARFDVSRETIDKLAAYAAMLEDTQTRMNLVGPATLPHIWERHFADSAQLLPLAGEGRQWLDLGAGAGFPGLVIAIMDPAARLTLVESIAKKCRFLGAVSAGLGLDERVTIANMRIEHLPHQRPDIITARALASLAQLFRWGLPHSSARTVWLLPKGARHAEEIGEARASFAFHHEKIPSITSPEARIIKAWGVRGVART